MQLRGARLGDDINLAAGAAVLSAELRRLDLELGDGVNTGGVAQRVVVRIGVDGAVQQERGVVGAAAGHAEAANLVLPEDILLHGAAARVGAGHQQRQLDELPPVQRQRLHLLFTDDRALGDRVDRQQPCLRGHLYRLTHVADPQGHFQTCGLRHLQV